MADVVNVDPTGDDYIDGLLHGTKWSGETTFRFLYDDYYDPIYPTYKVSQVSYQQFLASNAILIGDIFLEYEDPLQKTVQTYNGVSSFTNINIGISFDSEYHPWVSDIDIANSPNFRPAGQAYSPSALNSHSGEVWFTTALDGTAKDLTNPLPGNFAYATHLKLLGQVLGLKASGRTGGVSDVTVPADRDSLEYTVMSARAHVGGPADGWAGVGQSDFPQTYMSLDIAALQALYGADYTYNARNTTYFWNPATAQMSINGEVQHAIPLDNKLFMTIWDGGGIDTYDFSRYHEGITVDLSPGGASLVSQVQRAYLGDGVYAQGNVYNAYLFNDNPASLIENAIGGRGNDTLRGNSADNILNGGGGADAMIGLAGNDSYVVDYVGDVVVEAAGEGTETVYVRATGYVLPAHVEQAKIEEGYGNVEIWGNAEANLLAGNAGNNALHGGAGADVLYGMAGADTLDGGTGPDQMIGGLGSDTYVVDHLSDVVYEAPGEGVDTLWTSVNRGLDADFENIVLFGAATDAGGNGKSNIVSGNELANNLYGGGGSDSLYGKNGNDRLFGEDGNDYMTGGKGTDAYYGGAGYDYAILEEGGGVDYFVDWNASRDRVVFDSAIFASIGAAMDAAFQNGSDVVIWDGSDGIVLQNARLADLTTSNFLIA